MFSNNAPCLFFSDNAKSVIDQLLEMGGLTFYKEYDSLPTGTVTATQLNANVSAGSPTATFTATRSASAPATYVDDSGVMQVTTTSNVGRIRGGYYDATGFHKDKGLVIEGAGTNLLKDSYFGDGTTTYWIATATATVTNDSTYTNPYGGGKVQKYVSAATNDGIQTAVASKVSVTNGTVYTVSCLVRGSGTAKLYFDTSVAVYGVGTILEDKWVKLTTQFTANATQACSIGVVANDGTTTGYVAYLQCEVSTYATSFIPTTTAALTRNAEGLSYVITGNRTVAAESCHISFMLPYIDTQNTNTGYFLSTRGGTNKETILAFTPASDALDYYPNITDTAGCRSRTTAIDVANTKYVISAISAGATAAVNALMYQDAVAKTPDSDNYTEPNWSNVNAFTVGSRVTTATSYIDGTIHNLCFYGRANTPAEVTQIKELLD